MDGGLIDKVQRGIDILEMLAGRVPAPDPFPEIEFHSSFRFKVVVDGISQAVFTEFKLPSLQVETLDVKEGGQNTYIHRLPVRINQGRATLRQGITRDIELLAWYMEVLTGDFKSATRKVDVTMYNVRREPIITWNFHGVYPTKWDGPTLKADASTVAIEALEFIHHGFSVQTYS